MLKYHNYSIVFQEIPGEVTLAINLTNCPHRCKDCHSAYLQHDSGAALCEQTIDTLLAKYGQSITCICFMGGDTEPEEVVRLAEYVRKRTLSSLKTAWYSGQSTLSPTINTESFNYLKLGPYITYYGGLDSPDTNQRFYKIEDGRLYDMTSLFQKNGLFSIE